MRARLVLITALAAAACGRSEPAGEAKQAPPVVVQGAGQKQMHEMSELNRAIALKRAIYDTGATCKRVTNSGYVTEYNNLSMWTASCDDGRDWAIFIAPNDVVQVRPCKDLVQLKLPECKVAAAGAG